MNTLENQSVNLEDLKKELLGLPFPELREKFNELDIASVWKGGVKKEVLINAGIEVLKERQENPVSEKPIVEDIVEEPVTQEPAVEKEDVIEFRFQEGETVLEEMHFTLVPGLKDIGFELGDTLISEPGKPFFKKVDLESAEELLNQERLQKVVERAKELGIETEGLEEDDLYEAILDAETLLDIELQKGGPVDDEENPLVKTEEVEDLEVEAEVVEIEVIDETKFTEEEILENIEITQANLSQAIPATRIFLLRKADALEAALSRKRK